MWANRRAWLRTSLGVVAVLAGGVILSSVELAEGKDAATAGRAEGLAAWGKLYSVLISPRCLNCHTAGDHPQQGDDRHRHSDDVVRGPEGKGVSGLNCSDCHGESNNDGTGVPGAHDWHLAPLSMRWQDERDRPLSSAAVCSALTDRSRNGGRDGPGLLKHMQEEPLLLWSFSPGRRPDGSSRRLPPMTHAELVETTRRWVDAGTPCPRGVETDRR
jgi:hypothetical protein